MTERLHRAPRPGPAGIVHLGLGAFFRAHGALYIEEAMAKSGGDWGAIGVNLVRPDRRDKLAPQGFAYTALELGPEGRAAHVAEILRDVLVARENPGAVLAAMSAPEIRIVSLTVTEKGYCHEPATGALDFRHPDIIHDLAHPETPRSAIGYIARGLARRKTAGLRPFTVMSCDNLPHNGALTKGVVLAFARRVDAGLAAWIEAEGAFPSTMVDRIVPATKPEDIETVATLTGTLDLSPVLHEPFRQWAIEDAFVDGARPDLGAVGVDMVADVAPYEHMKLRCLNGPHSALAYLGGFAGHETVAGAVADPVFAAYLKRLWRDEILPALEAPPGVDLPAYTEAILARFANPAIRHLTAQIAMDGSQKLPQRILATVAENRAAGRESPGLTLAVAAWALHMRGVDLAGAPIEVRDPLAAEMRAIAAHAPTVAALVDGALGLRSVFPAALAEAEDFRAGVLAGARALLETGARGAVEAIAMR